MSIYLHRFPNQGGVNQMAVEGTEWNWLSPANGYLGLVIFKILFIFLVPSHSATTSAPWLRWFLCHRTGRNQQVTHRGPLSPIWTGPSPSFDTARYKKHTPPLSRLRSSLHSTFRREGVDSFVDVDPRKPCGACFQMRHHSLLNNLDACVSLS